MQCSCPTCGQDFGSLLALNRHKVTQHPELMPKNMATKKRKGKSHIRSHSLMASHNHNCCCRCYDHDFIFKLQLHQVRRTDRPANSLESTTNHRTLDPSVPVTLSNPVTLCFPQSQSCVPSMKSDGVRYAPNTAEAGFRIALTIGQYNVSTIHTMFSHTMFLLI